MTDILSGIRVIELATWTFVPAAGAVLADWGADVIKVEHPETGDPAARPHQLRIGHRRWGSEPLHRTAEPEQAKHRPRHLDAWGLELLMKLVETADVFLTNLLPDSRQRMGVDVEQIRARNPAIIYARGHGYGARGDLRAQGGYDLAAYWARGGIGEAYRDGDGSYPPLQRSAFGDSYGGLAIAAGVAAALVKRERTKEPSIVDVSLLNAAIWQLGPDIVGAGITGRDIPKFSLEEMPNPVASMYKTRDDRFIALVLLQADRFWSEFCTRLGRPDLIDDKRFASAPVRFGNRVDCIAELRRTFESEDLSHWEKAFEDFEGVWDVMRTAREVHDDPQVIANGYLPRVTDAKGNEFALAASPVQFDETELSLTRARGHGEHTDALLAELGFTEDEIIDFKINSVVL